MRKRETDAEMADERKFNGLVGKIQAATLALRRDALGVINRSVTARAWLTGYYIVEFEQGGKARAVYGDGLLKRLSESLGTKDYSVHTLKKYREFYRVFPRLAIPIRDYLIERFGKGYSANIQLPLVGETISCVQGSKLCQIGYSPNIQSKNLLEFDCKGENVSISPYALFSSLSYTHMSNLLSLPINLYMEYYRKRVMTEGDNPPIGILMCTEVGKELAEYIAPYIDERLFLAKYMLQLPSKEILTGFLKKENEGLQANGK